MKLKQLESLLQQLDSFPDPKIHLEQYQTSALLASRILLDVQEDLKDKTVLDLGCGSGIFTAGPLFLEADFVLGVDVDEDAIEVCRRNLEEIFVEEDNDDSEDTRNTSIKHWKSSGNYDLLVADITNSSLFSRFSKSFNTVIMNPPFGTRVSGVDMSFLDLALDLATDTVYSLHKTSTRQFIARKIERMPGIQMKVVAELKFDLPASYKFHKHKSVDIAVDFIRFSFN